MKKHVYSFHDFHNHVRTVMFIMLIFLISVFYSSTSFAQTKVKVFLMAGQSNMQGHGSQERLERILCAKGELDLPDDPNQCFQEFADAEDRIFATISHFYGNSGTYDSVNSRVVAQGINENHLVDGRLFNPFDKVQAINFNYSRNDDGVRGDPGIWSGPLKTGFGHSKNDGAYGPELIFGHYISQHIDDDIVLLKVAEGGTNLYEQWRSPSMEARLGVGNEPTNYPLIVQHLNEVKADIGSFLPKYEGVDVEIEVAGFIWFQGWNDVVGNTASTYAPAYEQNLTDLVTDLRNDLNMPNLPVVIGQTQNDGFYGTTVQKAQESVANIVGNAQSFVTTDLSNYYHYDAGAYLVIGNRMGEKMAELQNEGNSNEIPAPPTWSEAIIKSGDITLNWIDNSNNETGFKIERSVNSETGFTEIATVSANTRAYYDDNLPKGTYYYRISAFNGNGSSNNSDILTVEIDKILQLPWISIDVGFPALYGSAGNNDGTFTVEGSGAALNGRSDQFHYVYQSGLLSGEIIARIDQLTGAGTPNMAGIMMRMNSEPDVPYAALVVSSDSTLIFKSRGHQGASTANRTVPLSGRKWLKLVRTDVLFAGYASVDGQNWELIKEHTLSRISDECLYGLAVTSNNSLESSNAVFNEVSIYIEGQTIPQAPSSLAATAVSSENISLSWTDNSNNETGFKLERSTVSGSGFVEIETLGAGATSYEDAGLDVATTYYYRIKAYNSAGASAYSAETNATTEELPVELPSPWEQMGIGEPAIPGSAGYVNGIFTVEGSGEALNGKSDQFHYVYQSGLRNGEIVARIDQLTGAGTPNMAGIMMRLDSRNDVPYAALVVSSDSVLIFKSRGHRRASTANRTVPLNGRKWLKLVRTDILFAGYASVDGQNWELIKEHTLSRISNQCLYGLAVTSNNSLESSNAVFSQVGLNIEAQTIPQAPSSLAATAVSSENISLSWTDNSDNETGFILERSMVSGSGFVEIETLGAGATSYEDAGLDAATTYYYRIKAYNGIGESDYTAEATATTLDVAPQAPSSLVATAVSSESISLSWTDNSDNETGFKVERSTVSGSGFLEIDTLNADANSYEDTGLEAATTYFYRVKAYNSAGASAYSAEANATTEELPAGLPSPWEQMDIGEPAITGSAGYVNETFTVEGSGEALNGKSDQFHYVYQSGIRNGEIVARIDQLTGAGTPNMAGIMMRLDSRNDVPYAALVVSSDSVLRFKSRGHRGASTANRTVPLNGRKWLKLVRTDVLFVGYASIDGQNWELIKEHTLSRISDECLYGLAVTSNDSLESSNAVFSEVDINIETQTIPQAPSSLAATAVSPESISLSWTDNSDNETGFILERSTVSGSGFVEIETLNADATSYEDTGLDMATTYYYRVKAYNGVGESGYSNESNAQTSSSAPITELPFPWENGDIGSTPIAGSATYEDDAFIISGSGDVDDDLYDFHFVYRTLVGDGEIIARISELSSTPGSKIAGVMMRNNLKPEARQITMSVTNEGKYLLIKKHGTRTDYKEIEVPFTPQWVRLVKAEGEITVYYSEDGVSWISAQSVGAQDWRFGVDLHVGLVVSNSDDVSINQATFNDVVFNQVALEPDAPVNLVAIRHSPVRIMLNWSYESEDEATMFSIERSLFPDRGFKQLTTAPHTNYEDAGLLPSTTYYYKIRTINDNGFSLTGTNVAHATTMPGTTLPPEPWEYTAIGQSNDPDGVVYNHGKFEVKGTNQDLIGTSDQINFVHQPVEGNCEIIARFNKSSNGLFTGIMMREQLGDNTKYIMIGKNDQGFVLQTRNENGALAERRFEPETDSLTWLKIERSGNTLFISASTNKSKWEKLGEESIDLLSNLYVGLAVSGGNNQQDAGIFEGVIVSNSAVPVLVPQRLISNAISSIAVGIDWEYGGDLENVDFIIERSLNAHTGFEQIASLGNNTYYTDTALSSETAYFYRIKATIDSDESEYSEVAQAITGKGQPVPSPWKSADVGEPYKAGYSTFENDTFKIWGAGYDIKARKDEFHYVYQKLQRNGELICKVNHISDEGPTSKAGLMVRESLSGLHTRMFYVSATTNINNELNTKSRDKQNAGTHGGDRNENVSFPLWLKLVKDGNYFTSHYATDGVNWIQIYKRIVPLDDEIFAGLFVNSNNEFTASGANITDVSIIEVATPATPRELEVSVNDMSTEVTLTWKDYANGESGFIIERSTSIDSGFETIATTDANAETFIDTDAPLTTCYYRVSSYDDAGSSSYSNTASVYVGTVPFPWTSMGIGHSQSTDTAVYRAGVFTITDHGTGIEGTSDQFRYLYQDVLGDGEIIVKLNEVISDNASSKVGLMIRETLEPNSKMVAMGLTGTNGSLFSQERAMVGVNSTSQLHGSVDTPLWLKFTRSGNTFTVYSSSDSINWTEAGQTNITISDKAYFGMMASGISTSESVSGIFEDVVINKFNIGVPVLHLSRRAGDYDKLELDNLIHIQTTPDTAIRRNTYTGMQGKTIDVFLADTVRSNNATISFKFIPDSLNQTVNLLETDNLVVNLNGDRVTATIAGQQISSDMPISNVVCNHVALRFSRQEIGFYVNAEWQTIDNTAPFQFNQLTLNDYKGQTWDVQAYEGLLTNSDVTVISQKCVPAVDASEFSPFGENYTHAICGAYKCLWAKEDVDLMQERFLYHLYEQDRSYEYFTFRAGMHVTNNLEWSLDFGKAQNWLVTEDEAFITGTFSDPMVASSGDYFFHENFHNYQGFYDVGVKGYGGSKWLNEATANWAASFRYDYAPNSGVTGITLNPHYPMLRAGAHQIPDGNRDYHSHVLFSYITRFVSTPLFIGKLFNYYEAGEKPLQAIQDLLAEEGHDFAEVFNEYAVRTTVWDYQDGSGPEWKAREQSGIDAWEYNGWENFNHKFSDIMDATGTGGIMRPLPLEYWPGVYSWNAFKVESTADATYTIKLKGTSNNPIGTRFRATIVKGVEGNYTYTNMPVSNAVAFGTSEAQIEISTQLGEELYLIVVSIPDEFEDVLSPRYQYSYSFEANEAAQSESLKGARENTGMKQNAIDQVSVYPNPTEGHLTIAWPSNYTSAVDIELFDVLGKKVPFTLKRANNQLSLDFDAPAGNYTLHVITQGDERTFQIIKK